MPGFVSYPLVACLSFLDGPETGFAEIWPRAAFSSTTVPRSRRLWLTARRFGRVPSLSRRHTRHQKDHARIVCANSETTLEIISTRALLLLLLRHNWQNQLVYSSSIIAQPDVQLGSSGMRHAQYRPSESIGHRGALLKLGVCRDGVEQIQTRPLQGALLVQSVGAAQLFKRWQPDQRHQRLPVSLSPFASTGRKRSRPEGPKLFSGSSDTPSFNAFGCIDQTGTELVVVPKAPR